MFRASLHSYLGGRVAPLLWSLSGLALLMGCSSPPAPPTPPTETAAEPGDKALSMVDDTGWILPSGEGIEVETEILTPPETEGGIGLLGVGGGFEVRWRAGLVLRSADERFGGFSGLLVDGESLLAVSDRGYWWTASLRHRGDNTLTGVARGRWAPIADLDGEPVSGLVRSDAEELALWGRHVVVSFEREHRLHAYHGWDGSAFAAPRLLDIPSMLDVHENRGLEAVTVLEDGRFFLVAEGDGDGAPLRGWISGDAPASERGASEASELAPGPSPEGWRERSIVSTGNFRPTAAATLPGGDVLLLQRSFSKEEGVRIALHILRLASLDAGPILPVEIARLEPPVPVDNMEAMDIRPGPEGGILVYVLADDNYSDDQDTLLLQLEMVEVTAN